MRIMVMALWAIAVPLLIAGCQAPTPVDAVWVEIPPNASIGEVAGLLAERGVVESAEEFERYARVRRRHRDIRPGIYPLRARMQMAQVLWRIRRGGPPLQKVLVRERITVAELALQLEELLDMSPESVLVAAQDPALRARVGARGNSVEGYLYPTVYYINRRATPLAALRQMVDTFEARWSPAWTARLDSLGLSRDEVVTLASIIAGEMPHDEDRLHVSSVYHNRLTRGMRLQADPTVVYALGERRRLYNNDYRVRHEYNTYTIDGLPPGPIGQPSASSIEAALYPGDTDYLFFVGRWDGRHEFSRTYREHLRTIAQIRGRGSAQRWPRAVQPVSGRAASGYTSDP
jgi:UPF0755 protein